MTISDISDISGGRFGLDIVSGLEKGMYSQMGIWPGDEHFTTRYEHATEFATIVRELWETGHSDFKGRTSRWTTATSAHCRSSPSRSSVPGSPTAACYTVVLRDTVAEAEDAVEQDYRTDVERFGREVVPLLRG